MGALAASVSPAHAQAPSVRLFAADRSVRVTTQELAFSMNVGLWVASTGGDFAIRAERPGYGRWQASQIDATSGAPLRAIPGRLVDARSGLKRFIDVRFLDRKGRVVVRRELHFCPGSAERLSPDGPRNPTYLSHCGFGFPFLRGALWGIDRGWAGPAAGLFGFPDVGPPSAQGRPLRVPPGRYRVRASIRAEYRRLFEVATEEASAGVRVRVVRGRGRRGFPPPPIPPTGGPATFTRSASIDAAPDPATLPDLVALPPWQVSTRSRRDRDSLLFAGSPWNAGPGPLWVEGYRRPGRDAMAAVQSFVDRSGNVTATAPAGRIAFHSAPGHNHWHFLQFVAYRIVRPSGGEVVRSRKQSFCLAATDAVDLTMPGAELRPDAIGLGGSACGDNRSIWIRETLPAGWGDTYHPFLPGQRFDITRVPNGRYLLEMQVNPRGELQEANTANNVARRRVVLGGKPGRRTVRVAPWHGIRD
jgi:Lysyl oxidase